MVRPTTRTEPNYRRKPKEQLRQPEPGPNTRKVTFVSMISSGGGVTTYGIYRGLLRRTHRPASQQFINYGDRFYEQVGCYRHRRGAARPTLLELAREFQTDEYPAFNWGREDVNE